MYQVMKNPLIFAQFIIWRCNTDGHTTQRAHDVNITSPQCRCNVMTLHGRRGDVVFTSCACRE